MPTRPFLESLDERVLVCDGAMGTLLYSKGVFINRSFESLNLTHADLVRAVHQEYLRAGAEVIETNTFGANRIKLRAFGLSERVQAINSQGARLAREAAGDHAYVAGAIGPLGVRIEPWGKTGVDEAEQYFKEQAAALVEGGVDLFVLETFRDLNEIGAAIAAVRNVCDLPIVAQMTTEEDGSSLDGTPPEQFAPVLVERGAAVVGVNCSVGPARIAEKGTVDEIFNRPHHPYTWGLLGSLPRLDTETERLVQIPGQPPSLLNPPRGCRFHPRCPYVMEVCKNEEPQLKPVSDEPHHVQACWLDEQTKDREAQKLLAGSLAEAS